MRLSAAGSVERPAFIERNQTELGEPCAQRSRCPPSSGYVGKTQDNTGKPVTNSAALIGDGKILFEQRKMLLPTYDVFDEARYFQPAVYSARLPVRLGKARHHDLRGFLERQKLLAGAALRARPRLGNGREGKHGPAEYFVIALHSEETRAAERHAAGYRHQSPCPGDLCESGRRQRQPDFRWFERGIFVRWPLAASAKSFEEDMVFFDTATGQGDIRPPSKTNSKPSTARWSSVRGIMFANADFGRR